MTTGALNLNEILAHWQGAGFRIFHHSLKCYDLPLFKFPLSSSKDVSALLQP